MKRICMLLIVAALFFMTTAFVLPPETKILIRDEVERLLEVFPAEAPRFQEALDEGRTVEIEQIDDDLWLIKDEEGQIVTTNVWPF